MGGEEDGQEGKNRGGTRKHCEQCDRGQTEQERRDSPFGIRCLFQLTPHTLTHTHTLAVSGQLVSVQFFFLSTAAGHGRMFNGQFQANTRQQTNATFLEGGQEIRLLCKPYNTSKQTGKGG